MKSISRIFLAKLKKLEQQLMIARLSDYAYPDGRDALDTLHGKLRQRATQVLESESYSAATRNAILRDINYLVSRVTAIVGIIIRSVSVRNAFEMYAPFLEICRILVSEDAKLILSSEWEYVPFTYPQNLADLPKFIVIGLPASESDNVLVFPAAGHELGHTVWAKNAFGDHFKAVIEDKINDAFVTDKARFEQFFPDLKDADLDQDLFVQHIKSIVFSAIAKQAEETFSDFLGLILFGESYLWAFEYLVAPQISGYRSFEYPDLKQRATTLENFAREKMSIDIPDYSASFLESAPFKLNHDVFIADMADKVLANLLQNIFAAANSIVSKAAIPLPTKEKTQNVYDSFSRGAPFDGDAALGDLINAGWRLFSTEHEQLSSAQGQVQIDHISDLVLKSAEIREIGSVLT